MEERNLRGAYMTFAHDRASDWAFLEAWQPAVIRIMLHGSHSDPQSVSVSVLDRLHQTCPEALILGRIWDLDDRYREAHEAMVANPHGEAEKLVQYWARVFERTRVPRHLLMGGLWNEVHPPHFAALHDATKSACVIGKSLGVRLGVGVFSVGTPDHVGQGQWDMRRFAELDPLIIEGNHALILHEYMQPEGMYGVWTDEKGEQRKDYGHLIGRHKQWPTKVPIIIGEWGIEGLLYNRHRHPQFGHAGWRHFPELWTPERIADEYVACVQDASDNVIGICPFLWDNADKRGTWHSFDMEPANAALLARKQRCVKTVSEPHVTRLPKLAKAPMTIAYVQATAGLNMRSTPVDGRVVLAIPYGEQVDVLGYDSVTKWFGVRYQGIEGWAHHQYLGPDKPKAQEPRDNTLFHRSMEFVRRWEGGWADDPNDPGGATMKGITIGTYTRWCAAKGKPAPSKEDLRNISDAEVNQIYYEWYWLESGADKLAWPDCLAVMDLAVNGGTGKADELTKEVGTNWLRLTIRRMKWYTTLKTWQHFGRAWHLRCIDLLEVASA